MGITINMKRELDDEFVSNVLITAFDGSYGGCWYWADLYRDGTEPAFRVTEPDTWTGVRIALGDQVEETTGEDVLDSLMEAGVWVDADTIRVGIQRLLDGDVKVNDYILEYLTRAVAEADAGDVDSDVADCIVQAGVFGKLIFG